MILNPKIKDQHEQIAHPNHVSGLVDPFDLEFAEHNHIGPHFEKRNSKTTTNEVLYANNFKFRV